MLMICILTRNRIAPPCRCGVLALAAALLLRAARVSAYRLYAAAVLVGGVASWAGWL